MTALVAKANISGTPSRSTANAGFADLWEFLDERLATGDGSIAEKLATRQALGIAVPRSHIAGLTMSTAGSSTTMTVAAGQAAGSANTVLIDLPSAIAKTTSAWAVGAANGGLDTGSIANNTWYHFHLIQRADTGVVDVLISLSATAPTLPTSYTDFRRIGSGRTNGSAQWVLFSQVGDEFLWASPVIDVDAVNPGAAAVTRTVTTPTGVVTSALLTVGINGSTTGANAAYFSSLSVTDQASQSAITAALALPATIGTNGVASAWNFTPATIRTNTAAQIRSRIATSGATDRIGIVTLGWVDQRGKVA